MDVVDKRMERPDVCQPPQRVFHVVMDFRGICGSGSAQDASHFSSPGVQANSSYAAVVLASWAEFESALTAAVSAEIDRRFF